MDYMKKEKASAPPRQYQNGTAKAENCPVRVPTDTFDNIVAENEKTVNTTFPQKALHDFKKVDGVYAKEQPWASELSESDA